MINWKLRFQNKATLWAIISLVVGLVYRILDALGIVPAFTADFVLEIAADGKVDEIERADLEQLLIELEPVVSAVLSLKYAAEG